MEYMFKDQRIKKDAAKTKIAWTLGPASRSVVMIEKLLEAGMNVARFDLSEGSHAYHQETLNNLRTATRNTGILCAAMLDTKGPEIRTGEGEIVNLPGDFPTILTQKDKDDILHWGIPNEINIIALSSVRKGSDLDEIDENDEEAVANVDEIMEKTDAVMLAKGNSIIIKKASTLGIPIVAVIQIRNGQTTDDELTNAVLNCTTDCVMLTATGDDEAHPDTALQRISNLCKELENSIDYKAVHQKLKETLPKPLLPFERRAAYASWNSEKIQAKAIIIIAKSAIKIVAKYRPTVPVLLVVRTSTYSERFADVASRGLVSRGIIPLMGAGSEIEDMISFAAQVAKKEGICNAGDKVVALRILDGYPALLTLLVP